MSRQDLKREDAIAKLKELAEGIDFTMMTTDLSQPPFHTIPMSTKKVDKEGNVWFLSGKDSEKIGHIEEEERALLTYSDPGSMEFLSVYGQAVLNEDRAVIKELYSSTDDAWFDGENDPNIVAIQIRPSDVHYWDSKNNKLVSLVKLGVGALTGKQPDMGVEGKLNVN